MSSEIHHSGPQEHMVAEITAEHMKDPTAEAEVHSALDNIAGVEMVRVDGEKITVCYDPVQMTQKEIGETLQHTGHAPVQSLTERESLMSS